MNILVTLPVYRRQYEKRPICRAMKCIYNEHESCTNMGLCREYRHCPFFISEDDFIYLRSLCAEKGGVRCTDAG